MYRKLEVILAVNFSKETGSQVRIQGRGVRMKLSLFGDLPSRNSVNNEALVVTHENYYVGYSGEEYRADSLASEYLATSRGIPFLVGVDDTKPIPTSDAPNIPEVDSFRLFSLAALLSCHESNNWSSS